MKLPRLGKLLPRIIGHLECLARSLGTYGRHSANESPKIKKHPTSGVTRRLGFLKVPRNFEVLAIRNYISLKVLPFRNIQGTVDYRPIVFSFNPVAVESLSKASIPLATSVSIDLDLFIRVRNRWHFRISRAPKSPWLYKTPTLKKL
ncbi:hypothetical protein J6590_078325 [Homalodisca vitripennis]|nr:hypothetical protein J6590_078325 [Homalodisca vitripennis]